MDAETLTFDSTGGYASFISDDTNVYLSPEQVHKASLVVVENVSDKEEMFNFLLMLGLIKEKE